MSITLQDVATRLSDYCDHPTGLTSKKISDRAVVLDDSDSDEIIFEVERHNAVLGAQYTPGAPMAAFITRWIKYRFNTRNNELVEIGDNHPPELDAGEIDFPQLAEDNLFDMNFAYNPIEGGGYLCTECLSHEEKVVHSVEEVIQFSHDIVNQLDMSYLNYTFPDNFPKSQIDSITKMLLNSMEQQFEERAQLSWSHRGDYY